MKLAKLARVGLVLLVMGCGVPPQTIAGIVVTVAGDVCKLISQDDPTAPEWATVACTVEGVAGQVVVSLPWSSWTSAQGQTLAQAKARAASRVRAFGDSPK
jgi:hypothetical protein